MIQFVLLLFIKHWRKSHITRERESCIWSKLYKQWSNIYTWGFILAMLRQATCIGIFGLWYIFKLTYFMDALNREIVFCLRKTVPISIGYKIQSCWRYTVKNTRWKKINELRNNLVAFSLMNIARQDIKTRFRSSSTVVYFSVHSATTHHGTYLFSITL